MLAEQLLNRQVNITARCPDCGNDMKVIAKLPMHTFVLECAEAACDLFRNRLKIRAGKIIAVYKPTKTANEGEGAQTQL